MGKIVKIMENTQRADMHALGGTSMPLFSSRILFTPETPSWVTQVGWAPDPLLGNMSLQRTGVFLYEVTWLIGGQTSISQRLIILWEGALVQENSAPG